MITARPQQEFVLDVIALIGGVRHVELCSTSEIHPELVRGRRPSQPGSPAREDSE